MPSLFRRVLLPAILMAALACAAPATAATHHRWSACAHANTVRRQVIRKLGPRAPGRDICRYGLVRHGKVVRAPFVKRVHYLHVLRRLNLPPQLVPLMHAGQPRQAPAGTATARANLPYCTWGPESGGNYRAYNPSSGAGGKYQIVPSTWRAYGGTGSPQSASPAEQDRVAARVYAGQGPGAWVNC